MLRKTLALALLAGTLASAKPVEIRPRQSGSNYPPINEIPDPSTTPKEWTDALNAAIAAGKIPDIPPATVNPDGSMSYPGDLASNPWVCSWTTSKCLGEHDIVNAPAGQMAVAFDDGPTGVSGDLYDFLAQHQQSATHFMIGSNVVAYPDQFRQAVQQGNQHFAVHTWSHHLMTSLTNEQVLAELGWTMQAIADHSGGYIPKFWRPPQGDVDNRVRAIAEEVFGLYNVLWNHDTDDWCLSDDGPAACPDTTHDSVAASLEPWINGAKDPGLIILEHELSHQSISVFKNYYPRLQGLGWVTKNVADLFGMDWYKNAKNNQDTARQMSLIGPIVEDEEQSSSTSSSSSSAPASSTSSTSPTTSPTSASNPSQTRLTATFTSTRSGNQHAASPTGAHANTAAVSKTSSAALALTVCACLFATLL